MPQADEMVIDQSQEEDDLDRTAPTDVALSEDHDFTSTSQGSSAQASFVETKKDNWTPPDTKAGD